MLVVVRVTCARLWWCCPGSLWPWREDEEDALNLHDRALRLLPGHRVVACVRCVDGW